MHEHETVSVKHHSGDLINIDAGIAPLISALWALWVDTLNCCENSASEPGYMWIEFASAEDAEWFLQYAAPNRRGKHGGIWGRIMQMEWGGDWKFETFVNDLSEYIREDDVTDYDGPPEYHFSVSVRFPATDYPLILKRVQEALSRRRPQQPHGNGTTPL